MWFEELDEYDNKILDLLTKDARLSYSEIGEQIGLSRVSVRNRMKVLEEKGIIQGYKAVVRHINFPEGRSFIIDVIAEPEKFAEVVDNFGKYSAIRRILAVTGDCRFLAEGFVENNRRYSLFMTGLKQNLDGIKSINVRDVQYTIKDIDGGVDYVRLDERDTSELKNGGCENEKRGEQN